MNLVINSQFRPFTYDEMVKPLLQYREEFDKVDLAYGELVDQTELLKDIATQENSPEAYAMYKSYYDRLNSIADSFSKEGLKLGTKKNLMKMKKGFSSEITPIIRASEAMKEANTFRDSAGPDAIFEVGRYNSIDDFLHGKTANNKYESRKDLVSRTATISLVAALSILEDPIIRQSMSPQFLEVILKRGLGSLAELEAAIAGNPEASNRFALIKSRMIDEIGGLDRFDALGRAAVEGAINEGLHAGLNNYLTSLQLNGEYLNAAQRISANQSATLLAWQKEDRDRAFGKSPIAIRPDGTKLYKNPLGEIWSSSPKKMNNLYVYKDSEGNFYYGDNPNSSEADDGTKITLLYENSLLIYDPFASNDTKDTKTNKLGKVLGVTGLTTDADGKLSWENGTLDIVWHKDDIEGATYFHYKDLDKDEQRYVDLFSERHSVNTEDLAIYRMYIDKKGNRCTPDKKGARKVLLITDK